MEKFKRKTLTFMPILINRFSWLISIHEIQCGYFIGVEGKASLNRFIKCRATAFLMLNSCQWFSSVPFIAIPNCGSPQFCYNKSIKLANAWVLFNFNHSPKTSRIVVLKRALCMYVNWREGAIHAFDMTVYPWYDSYLLFIASKVIHHP